MSSDSGNGFGLIMSPACTELEGKCKRIVRRKGAVPGEYKAMSVIKKPYRLCHKGPLS